MNDRASEKLYPMAAPDAGRINDRILHKEARKDFLARIESSRLLIETRLHSPEAKRMYVRVYDSLQLAVHTISVIARTVLDSEVVTQIEDELRAAMDKATADLRVALDGAELLLQSHQIRRLSAYAAEPLAFEAPVLSSFGRRYLEMIVMFDQLMPILETLAIYEVITEKEKDLRKGIYKKCVRRVAFGAREYANGLRRRMNAKSESKASAMTAIDPLDASGDNVEGDASEGARIAANSAAEGSNAEPLAPRKRKGSSGTREASAKPEVVSAAT